MSNEPVYMLKATLQTLPVIVIPLIMIFAPIYITIIISAILVLVIIAVYWVCRYESIKKEYENICPNCGEQLEYTMTPNDDKDPRFGCQIYGNVCTKCEYEHYENQD